VRAFRHRGIEFAIFDVFNVMHAADENDNTEMRRVLRQLSRIQAEVGCGIGVVHHFNKAESGSMTQRLRGSSAIAGWAEWLIEISIADEDQKIRHMEFELKAAQPPFDEKMFRGQWNILRSDERNPFILSDTPVVTWERTAARAFSYGIAFWKPNVEVVLPISPSVCLHILPQVERTRPTVEPEVMEVNIAQAAFASHACYADRNANDIDEIVQKHASTVQLGRNPFKIWHRVNDNTHYEILMSGDGPIVLQVILDN
jgi:hypothetical protein